MLVSRPVLVEEEEDESTTSTPEDETPCHVPIEDAVLAKMKVYELREELKKRKEPTDGLKAVLLAWLKETLGKEAHVHRKSTTTTANNSSSAKKTTRFYSIAEDS